MSKEPTEVEGIKSASRGLRGQLAADLEGPTPNVSSASEQLIKFHGIYAQDHRDVRRARSLAHEPLEFIFMTRVVIPGGHLTSEQWLALDRLADDVADGTLRLTTRQAVQFHGTYKGSLRELATRLDTVRLTSFGGCGDVVRNVVTCPHLQISQHPDIAEFTRQLALWFRPSTTAHWEIFVDGQRAASAEEENEKSFYGETYLPRKFKVAIANPEENCVDAYAQDVALVPTFSTEGMEGFNVIVGGGLGRNYAHEHTFSRLGDPLGFVALEDAVSLVSAIVATYRDLGDRTDRKRARLKYVVHDIGFDAFRAEVEARWGRQIAPVHGTISFLGRHDHLGWNQISDGVQSLGIRVSAGRVKDDERSQTRSALRQIATALPVTFYVTPQQDVIIHGIRNDEVAVVSEVLRTYGVPMAEDLVALERTALACPALPTCGQALTEAERELPSVVGQLVEIVLSNGIADRDLVVRMTGCPNGCARPSVAEIGIVGRTKSTYDIHVGGSSSGDRLATLWREKVPSADVTQTVRPLLERWAVEAHNGESFGDFVARVQPWV
jgi:sulfite reductase (ferredoxin)